MKFGDIERVELGSGQLSFVGAIKTKRRRLPLVKIDKELAIADRKCDHCRTTKGLPHKRTGELTNTHVALHINGDTSDHRVGNVMIVCTTCSGLLKGVQRG